MQEILIIVNGTIIGTVSTCIAVAIHYILDYMSKNPEYKCPDCYAVEHEHLPIKKEVPNVSERSNNNPEGKQG